jgi:hypothetical protein
MYCAISSPIVASHPTRVPDTCGAATGACSGGARYLPGCVSRSAGHASTPFQAGATFAWPGGAEEEEEAEAEEEEADRWCSCSEMTVRAWRCMSSEN